MIYRMAKDVEGLLRARGFPFPVYYGPEYAQRLGYSECCYVVERDRTGGDNFSAPKGVSDRTRPTYFNVSQAVLVTVFARSSVPGADVQDHESLCDRLVDGFITAWYEWAKVAQAAGSQLTGGRYLAPSELNNEQQLPGVAYRIRMSIPRAVSRVDFDGAGFSTATVVAAENTTEVRPAHAPESTPEIGCTNSGQ